MGVVVTLLYPTQVRDPSNHRDCLSGYGVVTSAETFKKSGVGVVHFSVKLILLFSSGLCDLKWPKVNHSRESAAKTCQMNGKALRIYRWKTDAQSRYMQHQLLLCHFAGQSSAD